jgi:nitronate monooxygenase
MLKTRITEQYGLKVPFINAGMAFIATAPLVRAVCSAGGMGMLGSAAMPPDALQAAIRDIKAVNPVCYGVNIIARFSGIEHIEVCVAERVPVVVFFWDDPPDDWLSRLRAAMTVSTTSSCTMYMKQCSTPPSVITPSPLWGKSRR